VDIIIYYFFNENNIYIYILNYVQNNICIIIRIIHMNCNKVIVWGLRNTWHTHQYIHEALYKAYVHMGYQTYWVNTLNELAGTDVSQSLIIYSGTDCPGDTPPIREDCFYFFHNSDIYDTIVSKYGSDHAAKFQVPKTEYTKMPTASGFSNFKQHYIDLVHNTIILPWGTNLLPHEIDENIASFDKLSIKPIARRFSWSWLGKTLSNLCRTSREKV